jgi:hypothetical protein
VSHRHAVDHDKGQELGWRQANSVERRRCRRRVKTDPVSSPEF